MKKERKSAPIILMLISIPFYFFGFYSLRDDNGVRIMGTYRFFAIGLTKEYGMYRQYFFSEGPHFINAVIILLIISLVMMLAYVIILAVGRNNFTEKQHITLSLIFSFLSHCFYASAVVIGVMFYSNILHASYVLQGSGRLGFSVVFVLVFQLTAFFIQYFNFIDYVLPKKETCSEEEEIFATISQRTVGTVGLKSARLNRFYIIGSKGDYKEGKIELPDNRELIIGKDPKISAVVIDKRYKKISRKHCGVIRKGYFFYVKDYSMNGTYMSFDGKRMQNGGVLNKVESGQRFNLANTDNEFYCQIE